MKENRCVHCGEIIPEGRSSCYICEHAKLSKRDKVMMELKDIANALNIDIDYVEEEEREYLICDGQKIATTCTSVSGIRQEFFGYVFLKEWKDRCLGAFDKQVRNQIRRYWYDEKFQHPWRM